MGQVESSHREYGKSRKANKNMTDTGWKMEKKDRGDGEDNDLQVRRHLLLREEADDGRKLSSV
jgi:hypothetical protein